MRTLHLTDHKTIGLQYAFTALGFLLLGTVLMVLIRWQLAWPTSPLPPALAALVGQTNAPGGFMVPEFYNQLVAMHGTIMIFLAVVPLLTGAFGNYLVPLQIGATDMAFPRLNAASYWIYVAAGLLMIVSFFVAGGAANSGWTSYPPLAVLATRGQDYWLAGIGLLGVSSMLNSMNVITTVAQLRTTGLTWMRLPFFVWAQLIAALLLLLAFPSLQAAAIFQLMDRLAGTSFFLPSGLVVSGVPLSGPTGGGDPLIWQHLFWFLAHPEVYVLVLPAIGIVAEIVANNTRRPLWGYRAMVGSTVFIGAMSLVVWAHHMFLTGMATTMGDFFQITTMIISIPSVVLVTSLMLSLWGGAIRFTTPMLFALAFLPMFGIGGLSGLPLGLAASDVQLHDTWYVVGHFHYLVAPGTIFAIFAGVYHWYPKVTGRALHRGLGLVHFWGSFVTMNGIFLPMFTIGLRGVNRRLYDAGMQYTHAQGTLDIQQHMTIAALALAVFQLPFLVNLAISAWRGARVNENPWDATTLEWQTESPPPAGNFGGVPEVFRGAYDYSVPGGTRDFAPQSERMSAIPSTSDERPDTRATNAGLGIWLFLASEAMLFGSLFSVYLLLRAGAEAWPPPDSLDRTAALVNTALLFGATLALAPRRKAWPVLTLSLSSGLAAAFLVFKLVEYRAKLDAGLPPAANLQIASWFVLTAVHGLHVAGGVIANVWIAAGARAQRDTASIEGRLRAVRRYWCFVDVVWMAILASFYVR